MAFSEIGIILVVLNLDIALFDIRDLAHASAKNNTIEVYHFFDRIYIQNCCMLHKNVTQAIICLYIKWL